MLCGTPLRPAAARAAAVPGAPSDITQAPGYGAYAKASAKSGPPPVGHEADVVQPAAGKLAESIGPRGAKPRPSSSGVRDSDSGSDATRGEHGHKQGSSSKKACGVPSALAKETIALLRDLKIAAASLKGLGSSGAGGSGSARKQRAGAGGADELDFDVRLTRGPRGSLVKVVSVIAPAGADAQKAVCVCARARARARVRACVCARTCKRSCS